MTKTFNELDSRLDNKELSEEKQDLVAVLIGPIATTHYDPNQTLDRQFPQTD